MDTKSVISLSTFSALLLAANASYGAFSIDFTNGIWTSTAGTTTGWPTAGVKSGQSGYVASPTTASSVLDAGTGLSVTVSSAFFGTAAAGPNNLKLNPPNTNGFTFQNAGTGDLNTGNTLNNYQRINFTFSNKVRVDLLNLEDIDRSSSAANPQWVDAATVQLWNGAPTAFGAGINPDVSKATTSNLTIVPVGQPAGNSRFGVPYVFASTGANTVNSDTASIASYTSDAEIDGFSIFFWNQRSATGGQHGIAIRAVGNEVSPVPEPSAFALIGGVLAFSFVALRRRR